VDGVAEGDADVEVEGDADGEADGDGDGDGDGPGELNGEGDPRGGDDDVAERGGGGTWDGWRVASRLLAGLGVAVEDAWPGADAGAVSGRLEEFPAVR
jgi:hypothetical protein